MCCSSNRTFFHRCGVEASNGKISYKEFLRRFQDRSEQGMPHKILANPLHRYFYSHSSGEMSSLVFLSEGFAKLLSLNEAFLLGRK